METDAIVNDEIDDQTIKSSVVEKDITNKDVETFDDSSQNINDNKNLKFSIFNILGLSNDDVTTESTPECKYILFCHLRM